MKRGTTRTRGRITKRRPINKVKLEFCSTKVDNARKLLKDVNNCLITNSQNDVQKLVSDEGEHRHW